MNMVNVLNFGIYDSKKDQPSATESEVREVDCFEVDFILSCDKGSASYIDTESQELFPNLLIVRKPGCKSHSRLHFRCYGLHLSVKKDTQIYNDLMLLPIYYLITNTEVYQNIFSDMFRHLVKSKENSNSYYAYSKILELVYHLKKDAEKNKKSFSSPFRKETLSIDKAIKFMKENFAQNISLKTLGELTGYSKNHFRNLFSAAMNISPQKYLEKIRIDNAKFLMIKNEIPISEIAYASGFSSQSYFTKAFKEVTGQTPGQFMKSAYLRYDG